MDPVTAIGVAGSVFGIVGFGIQLSELLSKYVTLARSAQEQLEDIADQIDLTAVVLNEIFAFLKREVDNNRLGRPLYLFTTESLLQIKETAVQCVVIFWRVEAAIFGNPAHLEKELPKKIVRFMNAFAQNSLDLSIQIKLKVTLDDLDDLNWRQKFRWPSKASKLDRFCEQLHRYERALTLLIQIVSLGQQRLKRNPNEKDIQFRQKTEEEIIHIIIASETQTQNHSWHANTKSEPSIPNHIKPARIPSWAATSSLPTKGFSTNLGPHSLRSAQSRNPLSPQSKDMSTSVRIPSSGLPQPPDGATFNSQTDTSDIYTTNMSPSPPPASGAQKPPVHARISMDDSRHPAEIKETYEKAPDDAFQEAVFDTEATKTHNAELKQRSSSALRNAQQNTTPSIQQPQSTQFPEEIDVRNTQKSESINEKHTDKLEAQILPYVLHGEGAYQLPVPLELKLKRKLQGSLNFGHSGKELTEKLAFLSSNQVQILQTLLRDNSGDQKRKLAHIEVAKKSSMRFWQRYTKVMIAFIEGEASGMPEGVSLVVPDLASTRSEDEDPRLPKNSPFVAPQYRILGRSSTLPSNHDSDPELSDEERPYGAWEEPTNSARTRRVRQQNDIPRIPVAPATSLQSPGQPNLPNMAGMFGIQDITHLLVADEERRKRLAQYKVWTIQPFWGIDQTEGSNNVWGRCVILEEHPDIPDVERRLTALDKDSMTTFDKMRTLTVSQQVQVQQSLEEVKSGTSDPEYQWKLRQLDVVRSTGWFKQNQIKKIVVYACPEPLSPAFKQHEESQSHHLQQNENSYGHPNNIQYDMGETGEDYIRRQPRDSRWHDIERANKAIASRSPPPRRSYERPVEAMRRQSSAYSRSRSPTTIQPRRPSTVPENALYTDYDPTDDDDPSGPDGFNDAKYYWPPNDDHGSAPRAYGRDRNNPTIQVRGNEVDLRKRGVISHPRRDMEVQRGRSPGFNHHPSTDWNSNLQSRRPSRRDSSYSRAPRHRRKSFTDLFMDKEKLRARLRENQTYPDEFDKRRYDPQLSSKAVKDKIDQLVIEWTPGWKNGRDNNNDGTDLAESIAYPHSTITLTEEPETLPSSSTSRAAATSLVEPRVDSQVESFSGKLAREVPAGKKLTFSPGEDWTSGTPATQPPLARTAMIESGDGASVSKPISEHPSNAVPPQTPDKSEDEDIGIPPIQKGDRAATLPTSMPGAQAWDIEWAKQIIEKTGTLSDPEDYQPLPRRSSRVVEESSSRRDRERQRGRNPHRVRQQFNTQHQRSPTAQRRSRNRSRGRYLTPPRRRTVEFQDVDDGHVPPRGPSEERYRQQPRGRYRQDGHY